MPRLFDDTRIRGHPDKELLARIKTYYEPFVNGDAQGLADLQSEDYSVTDIRKPSLQLLGTIIS
jgi:hypothetical protein